MTWHDIARRQCGVITTQQLLATGLTRRQIAGLRSAGHLRDDRRQGVHRSSAVASTADTECWSAVLAARGVLSHFSAAAWWAIDVPSDGRLHVTVPSRRRTRMPVGVHVHRVLLPEAAVVQRHGMAVTPRGRTVLDCIGLLRFSPARTLFDRGLQQKWISVPSVQHRLQSEPNRRGNAVIRRLLDEATMGDAQSERVLHDILRSAGLTGWAAGYSIDLGFTVITVDLCFVGQRLVIEIDGWAYHHEPERFESDRHRHNSLENAGWRVRSYTWKDLTERPGYVVASIRTALRSGTNGTVWVP